MLVSYKGLLLPLPCLFVLLYSSIYSRFYTFKVTFTQSLFRQIKLLFNMQFTSTIVAALSLLSVASAQGFVKRYDNGTYVTEVSTFQSQAILNSINYILIAMGKNQRF